MWQLLFIICLVNKSASQIISTEEKEEVSYQVAGIFESNTLIQQLAFNESVFDVHLPDYQLTATVLNPSRNDSYSVWESLCSDSEMRPIAVLGPLNSLTNGAVRDQCCIANIPYVQASWQFSDPDFDFEEEDEEEEEETLLIENEETDEEKVEEILFKNITINFFPDPNEVAVAYSKLLKYYKWDSFAALYEDEFGLLRIQKILAEHTTKYPVYLRKLDPSGENLNVFKDLNKYQDASRFLLDCSADRILKYLDDAKLLKMVDHYQHYILVSLDSYTVADTLTKYASNITWLSLTEHAVLSNAQHYLAPRVAKWSSQRSTAPPVTNFTLESLLMDDMANHILKAVQSLGDDFQAPESHVCDAEAAPWAYGAKLQNAILQISTKGVTGNITFDESGKRANYTLFVNEIYGSQLKTIGKWDSNNDTQIIEDRPISDLTAGQLTSKHFIVISRKYKPYFYEKTPCEGDDCDKSDKDEKYEGFSVDLVKGIFDILRQENFNYTYEFVHDKDKGYGTYNSKTKKWDGLIGDLLDKKADLAVCDLTITEERKKVVDFSVPFMTLGISILYTKEKPIAPPMFSFLLPYTLEVWMHIATAYCVVSVVLFVCSRISPADWENPVPCDKDPEELENIWNFKNCTWLTMGSIMTQGCDILPKAIGTRWVCGMWWFFAMIVCQTYIAQLSASMTSALEIEPINSIEDLAKQNKVLYGAIDGGSTYEFFKTSKDKIYRKIFETMEANPSLLVKTNDEGENRVLKSKNKYAFFMESSTIEYKQKRKCELKKVGSQLDSKDYGIAMPTNSPFRSHINRAILRLKELTMLEEIKSKWWDSKKYGAVDCDEKANEDTDIEGNLEMENLVGAFVVLAVGLFFCMFVVAAEFMNEIRNIVVREQVTHKEAIIKELRASLNFFQLQKPVLRNPSRAPSAASQSDKMDPMAALTDNFMEFEKQPH
ncbi:glutamate receptor ionotropic, kainate 2-like [Plodia interpunctella]|uniref:glutamate receptor ionotropic, kainate 2-like n=1 Tax=Plodia interpunctella TaxID=58824 RepID=UPI002367A0BE|nr:glutamate receptor ionotropic, kainate 2-like [Plodia interpunctella]